MRYTWDTEKDAINIPAGKLRDWEQGRKIPDAPARACLKVIEKNPELVAEWLNSGGLEPAA